MKLPKLCLHAGARVNHFEEKAAFVSERRSLRLCYAAVDSDAGRGQIRCDRSDRKDACRMARSTGRRLPGDWVVLRFGYSLLGITNHPATAEATGLEVDKLDRRFVKHYMEKYLDSYKETVGAGLDGQTGYSLRDQRQLGGRLAELDRPHDRRSSRSGADMIRCRGCQCWPDRWSTARKPATSSCGIFARPLPTLIADEHYGQVEETCTSGTWATTANRMRADARLWPMAWK